MNVRDKREGEFARKGEVEKREKVELGVEVTKKLWERKKIKTPVSEAEGVRGPA